MRTGVSLALLLIACSHTSKLAPIAPEPAEPAELTLLFTSDEHGWLLPHHDERSVRGGAAEVLSHWVRLEGHCPGPPSPPCRNPRTLALSGGDNYTGPALSSYFAGAPMAEAMARMGYAASAFGNHELDFGRTRFSENRTKSGMIYLAANLLAPSSMMDFKVPPYFLFERRGIKIGVVGLATDTTLQVAMATQFEGITFEGEESSLSRAVPLAWSAGADLVVVIAHECPDVLVPIIARHPEWRLSFVGAGHCHKLVETRAGTVPIISPGWRFDRYVRVRIHADPSRVKGERVIGVEPSVVEVSRPEETPIMARSDAEIARIVAAYQPRLDAALGEVIGWAGVDLDRKSEELRRWVTEAWLSELHVDVALVNRKAIRQGLPRGAISKASVWSVLPFDDEIVLLKMRGDALMRSLSAPDATATGAVATGRGWAIAGAPIDPARVYSVATIDFLYAGDHLGLQSAVAAEYTGIDWRDPVIAWTQKQRSSKAAPLDLEKDVQQR